MEDRSLLLLRLGHDGDAAGGDTTEELLGTRSTADLDRALEGVHGVATARTGAEGTRLGSGKGREDVDVSIGAAKSGETRIGVGPQVAVKRPVVGVEPPTSDMTQGDPAVIASIVKKSAGLVQSCVEVSLKANPDMSGRVELGFVIDHGRVRAATVEANDTGDTALGACIAHAVRTIRFPEDISAKVELPFAVSGR